MRIARTLLTAALLPATLGAQPPGANIVWLQGVQAYEYHSDLGTGWLNEASRGAQSTAGGVRITARTWAADDESDPLNFTWQRVDFSRFFQVVGAPNQAYRVDVTAKLAGLFRVNDGHDCLWWPLDDVCARWRPDVLARANVKIPLGSFGSAAELGFDSYRRAGGTWQYPYAPVVSTSALFFGGGIYSIQGSLFLESRVGVDSWEDRYIAGDAFAGAEFEGEPCIRFNVLGQCLERRPAGFFVDVSATAVPEPSGVLLIGTGLVGLGALARRRGTRSGGR